MSDKINLENKRNYEKISSILSDIEGNVNELNKCSSDDFIMLNKYLRRQYDRIEKISENVSNVFELRAGVESQELAKKIEIFANGFYSGIKYSDDKFENKAEVIEQIISYINLMYIPLKNYTQNVVTLNFLSNSLKFNLVYNKNVERDFFDSEIEKFQEVLEVLKGINQTFEDTSVKIKETYNQISEKIRILQENNFINTEKTEEKVNLIKQRLNDKFEEGKIKIPELKRIKGRYAESINKIITNLQYSDIIRQKMNHISEAHRDMIVKINLLKNEKDIETSEKFLLKIKDIADLQIAQLVTTNSEYQNAVKIISEKFVEIGRDVNNLNNETVKLSGLRNIDDAKEHDFYEIENLLENIESITNEFVSENTGIFVNLTNLFNYLREYQENYIKYEDTIESIDNAAKSVLVKAKKHFDKKQNIEDIIKQFNNVFNSLHNNKNNVSNYYNLCNKNRKKIEAMNTDEESSDLTSFTKSIHDILQITNKNNKEIKSIVLETGKLERNVSEEISSGMKQIKYYTFYEKTATKIILRLKELFENISIQHSSKQEKMENLEERKPKYTMKSERDIHEKLIKGEEFTSSDVNEDEEIEFF